MGPGQEANESAPQDAKGSHPSQGDEPAHSQEQNILDTGQECRTPMHADMKITAGQELTPRILDYSQDWIAQNKENIPPTVLTVAQVRSGQQSDAQDGKTVLVHSGQESEAQNNKAVHGHSGQESDAQDNKAVLAHSGQESEAQNGRIAQVHPGQEGDAQDTDSRQGHRGQQHVFPIASETTPQIHELRRHRTIYNMDPDVGGSSEIRFQTPERKTHEWVQPPHEDNVHPSWNEPYLQQIYCPEITADDSDSAPYSIVPHRIDWSDDDDYLFDLYGMHSPSRKRKEPESAVSLPKEQTKKSKRSN